MSWKRPRRNGTDQGKKWEKLNPAGKGIEFDASHADPNGYAERNFVGGEPTREAQYEAAREEQKRQQEERTKGRHRK